MGYNPVFSCSPVSGIWFYHRNAATGQKFEHGANLKTELITTHFVVCQYVKIRIKNFPPYCDRVEIKGGLRCPLIPEVESANLSWPYDKYSKNFVKYGIACQRLICFCLLLELNGLDDLSPKRVCP